MVAEPALIGMNAIDRLHLELGEPIGRDADDRVFGRGPMIDRRAK